MVLTVSLLISFVGLTANDSHIYLREQQRPVPWEPETHIMRIYVCVSQRKWVSSSRKSLCLWIFPTWSEPAACSFAWQMSWIYSILPKFLKPLVFQRFFVTVLGVFLSAHLKCLKRWMEEEYHRKIKKAHSSLIYLNVSVHLNFSWCYLQKHHPVRVNNIILASSLTVV